MREKVPQLTGRVSGRISAVKAKLEHLRRVGCRGVSLGGHHASKGTISLMRGEMDRSAKDPTVRISGAVMGS